MSEKIKNNRKPDKNPLPFIALLLSIAVIAVTSAWVIYNTAVNKFHQRKWKDYDDCGWS